MSENKTCPFCGDHLEIVYGGDSNPRLARHPMDPLDGSHCIIAHLHFPLARLELWNRRTSTTTEADKAMYEALKTMEAANEALCAGRPQNVYTAMLAAGQEDALLNLDHARRAARAALTQYESARGKER